MAIKFKNNTDRRIRLHPNRNFGHFKTQKRAQTNVIIENTEEKHLSHNLQDRPGPENDVQQRKEFLHVRRNPFACKMSEMGKAKSIKHEITLQSNKPTRSRSYSLRRDKEAILEAKTQEMLANDIIEPSKSEYASPCPLVDNKNGETRLVTNSSAINKETIHNRIKRGTGHIVEAENEQYSQLIDKYVKEQSQSYEEPTQSKTVTSAMIHNPNNVDIHYSWKLFLLLVYHRGSQVYNPE